MYQCGSSVWAYCGMEASEHTSLLAGSYESTAEEEGIRTLGTGVSPYNGLAIHKWVLNRYENLLLYSSFQRVTNRSI
jgi:hypothetical protein